MRYLPKDPRVLIAEGWCVRTPSSTPANCSWCGVPFEHHNGIVRCGLCDTPAVPGGLRVVDLDRETGDGCG